MQYRKGLNAVRTGHTAAFASLELGLEEGRGKDPGPGPKAEQRLSRCMALTGKQQISDLVIADCAGYSPLPPKCQNAAFWHSESPQTHNTTRTATHCRHHIAQCCPLGVRWRRVGSRLLLGPRQEWAHDTAKTEVSGAGTALGTQLVITSMARGLRFRSLPPLRPQIPRIDFSSAPRSGALGGGAPAPAILSDLRGRGGRDST
jgi:hypothetical protein